MTKKIKIPIMLKMTAIPPMVMTARASRSKMRRHITLVDWCDIVCRGVWPYAPTEGEGARAGPVSLVKFLDFLLDRAGLQWEKPVFDRHLLSFFTIDEFDEFSDDWIQRFIGHLVDIEIEVAPERIRPIVRVLLAEIGRAHV